MTNRQAHEDRAAGVALIRELISPAPADFIQHQYDVIWGDKNGTFAEKYGDDADDEIDIRATQTTLTADLANWSKRTEAQGA